MKHMHLGAFMRPVSIHTGWWRHPDSVPEANFSLKHLVQCIQTLERGKFDACLLYTSDAADE